MDRIQETTFPCWHLPTRSRKPRETGITHANDRTMGLRHVQDLCESLGEYIDVVKVRGWPLHTMEFVKKKNKIYKDYNIEISAGDYLEYVVLQGTEKVQGYLSEAKELGFTMIEVCDAIVVIPLEDKMRIIEMAKRQEFKVICEVGKKDLDWEKVKFNPGTYLNEIARSIESGAWKVMIESQGLAEFTPEINKDFYHTIVNKAGLKDLIFEAPNEKAFAWFISEFGSEVNLCLNADHVFEAEHYRRGLRGRRAVFGIVGTFPGNG